MHLVSYLIVYMTTAVSAEGILHPQSQQEHQAACQSLQHLSQLYRWLC